VGKSKKYARLVLLIVFAVLASVGMSIGGVPPVISSKRDDDEKKPKTEIVAKHLKVNKIESVKE